MQGWLNYHAVPSNSQSLCRFIDKVTRLWLSEIRKRSQRGRSGWTWERMQRLVRLHLPRLRVTNPQPNERFRARLKVGAVGANSSSTDLCGGPLATAVPTAITIVFGTPIAVEASHAQLWRIRSSDASR